ncbi:hypothetical protein [Halococcus sp. PRR34]|uniref:hypothetical protein n=1 Tax=Halococcus sp. PRR34 TaxID=3020830 RepID=UPI0023608BF9|nr:hypothetical protein [Halococcus sp. PRR34]
MRIKSESNSENEYEVTVDGGIEAGSGIGGRDRVTNSGRTAVGRVVSGVDEWRYWGQKTRIRADNPKDLLISINNKSWERASAFGGKAFDGSSSSGSSGGGGGGNSGGGSSGSSGGQSGPSIAARKRKAAGDADSQYIDPSDVQVIRTSEDYREAFDTISKDYGAVHAFAVADGTYSPGTIQAAFSQNRGAARIVFCGNYENPSQVKVTANHNIIHTGKDEHLRFQGMTWSRSQQVGPAMYRNMRFPDGFGGKPVGARIQDSYVRNIALYGSGALHIDWGVRLETTRDAYIHRANTADVFVHGGTNFASGGKPVTSDRDVRPDDLGSGLNRVRFANEV